MARPNSSHRAGEILSDWPHLGFAEPFSISLRTPGLRSVACVSAPKQWRPGPACYVLQRSAIMTHAASQGNQKYITVIGGPMNGPEGRHLRLLGDRAGRLEFDDAVPV